MSCMFETDHNTYIIRADCKEIYKVYRVEEDKETELGGFRLDVPVTDDEILIDAAEIVIEESLSESYA